MATGPVLYNCRSCLADAHAAINTRCASYSCSTLIYFNDYYEIYLVTLDESLYCLPAEWRLAILLERVIFVLLDMTLPGGISPSSL